MTELPQDSSRWPKDPFELLNLERRVDARTAKRAYFKLIREFKPDRFPVEFQKIREAYESVQSWLSWQDHRANDDDELVVSTSNEASGEVSDKSVQVTEFADNSLVSQADAAVNRSSKLLKTDPVELFFEILKTEGLNDALPHLKNINSSMGSNQGSKVNLLKYFIARFFPKTAGKSATSPAREDVDLGYSQGDLKRIAWLLQALNSPETSAAAMAQLRFEFDLNHRLANCKSVLDYLAEVQDFGTLADFFKLRWEAIGHYQPQTVVRDIKMLQSRSLEFGGYRGDWLSLLTESMNYTVWQRGEKYMVHTEACWQEISANDQTWSADSIELLMLAAQDFRMRGSASSWMTVIPWARNTLPETKRRIWLPVAKEISDDPAGSLSRLDYRFRVHSMAMTIFEEGLQHLVDLVGDSEAVDEMPWEDTRDLVSCFLMELGTNDYAESRIPIMEFCVLNQLSLVTFAAAANTFVADDESESWLDLIQRDAPLRCVVNACHATNW